MKTKAKPKKGKPFLAARIPHDLERALEAHIEESGETKTQLIINAIGSYIKWSAGEDKPIASDRLSTLEAKVAEIEKLIKTPQQQNLLDVEPVITKVKQTDNKTGKNKSGANDQLFTHRKVSDITGIGYNSVKSKPNSKNKVVEGNGRKFEVIKTNKGWKWREIS